MKVIGITGGVGSGKTKVLEYLQENTECEILIADQIANRLKEPGEKCYLSLISLLGEEILEKDGTINKGKMASLIFDNEPLLKKVNECIHPAVKEYILERIEKGKKESKLKVIFLEAALLIEAGYLSYLDELWYIYVAKEERIQRLQLGRGYSKEKTESIIKCQLSENEFRKYASVIIDNTGEFEKTKAQLKQECVKRELWR